MSVSQRVCVRRRVCQHVCGDKRVSMRVPGGAICLFVVFLFVVVVVCSIGMMRCVMKKPRPAVYSCGLPAAMCA